MSCPHKQTPKCSVCRPEPGLWLTLGAVAVIASVGQVARRRRGGGNRRELPERLVYFDHGDLLQAFRVWWSEKSGTASAQDWIWIGELEQYDYNSGVLLSEIRRALPERYDFDGEAEIRFVESCVDPFGLMGPSFVTKLDVRV
jgi:hypothetical protein